MRPLYPTPRGIAWCARCCCCLPESLRRAPRELWLAFLLKLVSSCVYFATALVFVPYLATEFDYDDVTAGTLYGVWGFLSSLAGVAVGPLIDRLGVRRSLLLGFVVGALGTCLMALAKTAGLLIFSVCVLLPLSTALGIPVLTIGIKRYTSAANRRTAYGIFYAAMNCGAVLAGPMVDVLRAQRSLPYSATAARAVLMVGALLMLSMALLAATLVRPIVVAKSGAVFLRTAQDVRIADDGGSEGVDLETLGGEAELNAAFADVELLPEQRKEHTARCRLSLDTFRDPFFWRLAVFSAAMTPVNMIFRHMDATLPTWLVRTVGDDVPYGTLYAINPLCVIVLSLVFSAALRRYDMYSVMTVGALISSLSVFVMAAEASVLATAMFAVLLSIGESMYSPLIASYTMALAPEGKEGSYTALSSAPLFSTKIFVGWISGALLAGYCAEGGESCRLVWVWVGAIALLTPASLLAARRFINNSAAQIALSRNEDGAKREDRSSPRGLAQAIDDDMERMLRTVVDATPT